MHSIAKKVADQASKKPTLSKSEFGSLLIASLKSRRGSRVALSKKQISKKVTRPPSKVTRKGVRSRKLVRGKSARKPLHKRSGKKSEPSTAICPELNDKNPKKETAKRKFKRRRIDGRLRNNVELDEPSRLQRRTRYLMIKMKMEQNLIDAYSGEGWKGQSREKIRPEKELLRAKKQILKCKLGIRDAIHQLDLLSAVGCIEDSVMAPDGSVSHEHIFCAKCKSNDVVPDNDIILCDGTCNCAFHQMCLEPPLHTENSNLSIVVYLPPGDQGWFCKFCECRMEIIDSMNAHLGTQYSTSCEWQDLFEEEAAAPDGGNILILEEEWPSDDSEDENYDPERRENSMNGAGTDESDIASSSTSLGWSSDDEAVSGSRRWDMEGKEFRNQSIYSSLDSDESSDVEIMSGRRKRRAVDYRKLYDEMFGKDAHVADQLSEDEDWGPSKRKKKEKESDAASTLMTLYKRKKQAKKDETLEGKKDLPKESRVRRALSRIPPSAVEVSKWFKNARYLALRSRKCSDSNPKLSGEATENENKSGGAEVSDAVTEVGLQTTRTSKDVFPKKKLRSNCGLKENDQKEVSLESQAGNSEVLLKKHFSKCDLGHHNSRFHWNQANIHFPCFTQMEAQKGDDPSLKTLLEEKSSTGKKHSYSKYSESPSHQLAESEMERLCRAKDTLENMRQFLGSLPISKRRRSKALVFRERVVYVPTAELKDKITTVG
ncbi:unnamed protein product [Linum tenue]|uniref:PHD-type domain-containing protein n=1 Tax=Linum tenue TaxID=586396 RepID=A0AAV0L0Y9_9ROSI|nr:unnamed protein product [Linum tenue]